MPGNCRIASIDGFRVAAGLEIDLAPGDGPRNAPGSPRRAVAAMPSAIRSGLIGLGQSLGAGLRRFEARQGSLDRLAEPGGQPSGQCRRRPDRDPLAQDGPHGHLEAVERAGYAQARAPADELVESRIDCEMVAMIRSGRAPRRRDSSVGPGSPARPGVNDVAISTASVFRPVTGSTFSQPLVATDGGRAEIGTGLRPAQRLPWNGPRGTATGNPRPAAADTRW